MKRNFSMLLLLTMLLPLTSCNSLEGKEIVAGEFPKGGKEVSYQEVKETLDAQENETELPNAFRMNFSSDSIRLESTQRIFADYVDGSHGLEENKASIQINNLNSSFEIDGLTKAKNVSELTAKASLGADLKVNFDFDTADEYSQLLNKFNDKSINLNGYLSHSNFYLDMDDTTNQIIEEMVFGNMYNLPNKVYVDAALLLTEDMFPLLSLEKLTEGVDIQLSPSFSTSVSIYENAEVVEKYTKIICEELFEFRQYKDEFLAIVNVNGEQLLTSVENILKEFYAEDILDDILDEDEPITQENFDLLLSTTKASLEPLKDCLKSCKFSFKFGSYGVSEVATDFLLEGIDKETSTTEFLYDFDFKVKFEYFESLEIQFPEFDSSYKSLLESLV